VDALLKATQAFETPNKEILAKAVDLYLKMLKSQEAIIRTMGSSKETMKTDGMTAIITDTKEKVFKMGGPKGKEFKQHLLVIEDTCELFYWFLRPDDPEDFKSMVAENFGGIDFPGAKVREQDGLHKAWYQALRKVHNDFYQFLLAQFPAIMKWTGEAADANAEYAKHMAALGGEVPAKAEAKPAEEKKEPAPVKAAPVKAAKPAKKPPTKVLKFKTWEVYDYGEEELVFAEEDVNIGMSFNFYNCVKTTVRIEGKTKSAAFFSCKKMKVHVNHMVAQIEMLKSDEMKLYPVVRVPQVTLEQCK